MGKLANALLSKKSRDVWSECDKMKGKNCRMACMIDGNSNSCSIAVMFSDKSCNSVPYDSTEMKRIEAEVMKRLQICNDDSYNITVHDVINAVTHLTRCTRGVRVVFPETKMRSSNSARINKSDFTTEKIVQCTHDSVRNYCSSQCCQLYTIIYMMYVVDQSKQCAQIYLQKNACSLKLQLLILFLVKSMISDMHHRITYMYINLFAQYILQVV